MFSNKAPDPNFGDEKPKGSVLTADEKAKRAAALRAKLQLPDTVRKKLGNDGPLSKLKDEPKPVEKKEEAPKPNVSPKVDKQPQDSREVSPKLLSDNSVISQKPIVQQ